MSDFRSGPVSDGDGQGSDLSRPDPSGDTLPAAPPVDHPPLADLPSPAVSDELRSLAADTPPQDHSVDGAATGNPSPTSAPSTTDTASQSTSSWAVDRRAISGNSTLVIEGDVIPRRIRRPADLMRLALAVFAAAVVFAGAFFASSTASGLDRDLAQASTNIPQPLVFLANLAGFLGVIALPVAAAVDLLIRRRGRQLIESVVVMGVAMGIVWILARWIQDVESAQLLTALTGRPTAGPTLPLNAVLAGTIAFITVARLVDKTRWAVASIGLVLAIFVANIVAGGITFAALTLSALIGWALGLLARYALGTPTTRPNGLEVASALEKSGFPLTVLRASHETDGGRRYSATTRSGARMRVLVLDRDLEGSGILKNVWRSLRLRDDGGTSGFSMRGRLEHAALQSYAAQAAGAPVPKLEAVTAVGPDAAALAYARIDGHTFSELGGDLTDHDLEGAWRAIRTLHDSGISHRALHAEHILRDSHGGIWLLDPEDGSVGAGDLGERLDIAEMLCTLAMLTDPDRSLATGRRVMGTDTIAKALPVLQPVALTSVTRKALKRRKDVLVTLRESLEELTPEGSIEEIQVERVRPRMVLTIIAGTIAAYVLLIQLGQIDLGQLIAQADWSWAFFALLLSSITYIGASMSVEGFIPEKLNFWRTTQAQLAGDFATLVSPPTLGSVGINLRYLQKCGVHPALAAASIGVSQVLAFVMHIVLVLGFGYIAGSQSELDVSPPRWAIFIGIAFVIALVLLFVLPVTRHWAEKRIRPILSQVGPRMLTLLQTPSKLLVGTAGFVVLNIGYCFCLVACVRAFGGGGEWAAICVVFLVGATVGQVAPTPGGLGAVEAALTAGLAGVGVDGGVALSAVLMFRVITFWLPAIPGWISFNDLMKKGYL